MTEHGSTENGINWIDGHVVYRELHTVINEAVVGFAHVYAYGVSRCTFLTGLKRRSIHNLEEVNFPPPDSFNHDRWIPCPDTSFPSSLAQPNPPIPSTIV